MSKQVISGLIISAAVLLCLAWIGCSDDTITTVSPPGSNDGTSANSEVLYYFPLNEGYQTIYDVVNSDGTKESETYTVGKEVSRGSATAMEWLSYTSSNGKDTGYFEATATALYYFEDLGAAAEKIIELPLVIGQSWPRYEDGSLLSDYEDGIDIIFDNDFKFPDSTDFMDGTLKNYPTTGLSTMTVTAIEKLQLDNGAYYSGAVKITNTNATGTYNIYWFAPGVGLVKYIIGASALYATSGSKVGELRSYGSK
ncbi:MAG: hypothetical protein OEW00_05040 [candidate division Zixibacteria bacterium]|nr:hypothetical protein [candidate division Zixibacteria bacterium]